MSFIRNFSTRWDLQYRRTPLLAKAVVTAAILVCTVTLIALHITLWDAQSRLEHLAQQAAAAEQENAILTEKVEKLGTVESYLQIAAEELGLVEPDTIIIESE